MANGIFKAGFMAAALRACPHLCPLIRIVKTWARQHGLNSPRNGTLNSYSLGLLCSFFLQSLRSPLLPPLWTLMRPEDSSDQSARPPSSMRPMHAGARPPDNALQRITSRLQAWQALPSTAEQLQHAPSIDVLVSGLYIVVAAVAVHQLCGNGKLLCLSTWAGSFAWRFDAPVGTSSAPDGVSNADTTQSGATQSGSAADQVGASSAACASGTELPSMLQLLQKMLRVLHQHWQARECPDAGATAPPKLAPALWHICACVEQTVLCEAEAQQLWQTCAGLGTGFQVDRRRGKGAARIGTGGMVSPASVQAMRHHVKAVVDSIAAAHAHLRVEEPPPPARAGREAQPQKTRRHRQRQRWKAAKQQGEAAACESHEQDTSAEQGASASSSVGQKANSRTSGAQSRAEEATQKPAGSQDEDKHASTSAAAPVSHADAIAHAAAAAAEDALILDLSDRELESDEAASTSHAAACASNTAAPSAAAGATVAEPKAKEKAAKNGATGSPSAISLELHSDASASPEQSAAEMTAGSAASAATLQVTAAARAAAQTALSLASLPAGSRSTTTTQTPAQSARTLPPASLTTDVDAAAGEESHQRADAESHGDDFDAAQVATVRGKRMKAYSLFVEDPFNECDNAARSLRPEELPRLAHEALVVALCGPGAFVEVSHISVAGFRMLDWSCWVLPCHAWSCFAWHALSC